MSSLLQRQSVREFAESGAVTFFAVFTLACELAAIVFLWRTEHGRESWPFLAVGFAMGSSVQMLILQLRVRGALRRGELTATSSDA